MHNWFGYVGLPLFVFKKFNTGYDIDNSRVSELKKYWIEMRIQKKRP